MDLRGHQIMYLSGFHIVLLYFPDVVVLIAFRRRNRPRVLTAYRGSRVQFTYCLDNLFRAGFRGQRRRKERIIKGLRLGEDDFVKISLLKKPLELQFNLPEIGNDKTTQDVIKELANTSFRS